ncbi:MAG: Rieske 2Fe-2S domain-containing protein [Nostoc sp.]|uniref:Rieske 2Fe-2S domain-containing protein n=1 Tax=Nostoc sp. TaxID=1180 RepID=UPI002FF7D3E4
MSLVKQKAICQLFVEIGRQQYSLVATAIATAHKSQLAWNNFVAALLNGRGDPAIEQAHEHLADVVNKYNQVNHTKVNLKTVRDYFVAKIIRSITVEPSELSKNWYFICQLAEIPHPGDFVTVQIFQEPLVAVRQVNGTIRVFLNVCTHRQAPVFEGHGCLGTDKSVLCPYHGWGFGIDGRCKNAPGANRGEFGVDFDLKNYSLQEVEVKIDENQAVFAKLVGNSSSNNSHILQAPQTDTEQNIGLAMPTEGFAIAKLLDSVSPGYAEGETASLPEEIRLWLRIGYLEEQLKHLIVDIEQQQKIQGTEVLLSSNLLLESLIGELKQAILTIDHNSSTPELNQVLQQVYSGEVQKHLTLKEFTQVDADSVKCLESGASNERREALPIWIYGDAELFALEVEHLIKPTWQFVCHLNEVPKAGNFTWLDIIGERAYVIRGTDGGIFAGKLKDVRERGNYPHFGLPNYGLEPIDIEVFYGFIFIRFTWEGSRLADTWYQPHLLDPYKLQDMQPIGGPGRYDINVEVDYKLLWENFLEDYHFPMMHKGLTRRFGVSSDCEGINGMIIPHRDPPSQSLTPIEWTYYHSMKTVARHSWEREKQLQDIATSTQSLPEPLCYSAFCSMSSQEQTPMPMSLSVFPEHVQVFSLVPAGPRECRFHVRSYGHPLDPDAPNTKAIADARLANIQLLLESLHEDIRVNYITQDSVSSRVFEKLGIFSIAEFDVAKFQEAIYTKLPITRHQKRS